MSRHSQDLTSQLKEMHQQAQNLEMTIQHRQHEITASEQTLATLDRKIENQTKQLLVHQAAQLKEQKDRYKTAILTKRKQLKALEEAVQTTTTELGAVDSLIKEAQDVLRRLNDERIELTKQITDCKATCNDFQADIHLRQDELHSVEVRISQKEEELALCTHALGETRALLHAKEAALTTIEEDYAQKTAKREANIALLDKKLLTRAQELESFKGYEEETRQQLTETQKTLDERDKLLRIREAKVAEGEAKLVQHSNLMNL